jgi:hypothetical protein
MFGSTDHSLKILEVFQSDFQIGVSERANDYPLLYLYRTCAPAYILPYTPHYSLINELVTSVTNTVDEGITILPSIPTIPPQLTEYRVIFYL